MARVLIAFASKRGSTAEIADAVAKAIREAGHIVDCRPADGVKNLGPYDAVVLGSAVYMKRWRGDAKHFVRKHSKELADLPFWVFSSGPVGDPAKDSDPSWYEPPARDRASGGPGTQRAYGVRRARADRPEGTDRADDGGEHPVGIPRPPQLGRDP